ncbi:hypothetical protein AAMO2058_000358900 [Amorphochlora amoebiformis]
MSEEVIRKFTEKADAAEYQIKLLTERLTMAEKLLAENSGTEEKGSIKVDADPRVVAALKNMQDVTIKGLLALRKSLVKAQEHTQKLEKKCGDLQVENGKLKYQIKHLKKSLDVVDEEVRYR